MTATTTSPSTTPTAPSISQPQGLESTAARTVDSDQTHLKLQLPGGTLELTLPPLDRLAFYAGLTGAAVLGVISWPLAVVTGVGHALADDHNNRALEAVGDAIGAGV